MPLVTFDDRPVNVPKWETIWTGKLRGGNTVSIDMTEYSKIKIYGVNWGRQAIFEMDLGFTVATQVSGYSYASTGTTEYINAGISSVERGIIECMVSTNKQTFFCRTIAYVSTNGSTFNNRNNSTEASHYFVYRIDGYK